jgi:hypothetical protein
MISLKTPLLFLLLLIICFSCENKKTDTSEGDVLNSRDTLDNFQDQDISENHQTCCAYCGEIMNWNEAYYWTYDENLFSQDKLSILQIGTTESFSDENGEIHKGIGSCMPYYDNGKYIMGVFCSYECAEISFKKNEPAPPSKDIEWADGYTYTYDYTEQIELKDSTGTKTVTVYIKNKPTNFDCVTRNCKWCRIEMPPQGYTFEEYPNLDVWRGKESGLSNGFFSSIQLALSIATDKQYWDLKNDRIRTEWTVDCDYGGPKGFCSLKCKSEYNNR